MATKLKFNWKALYNDLTERLIATVDELIDEVYRDVMSKLSVKGQKDCDKEDAVLNPIKQTIEASCVFYANAIVESYGIGKGADSSSESYWNDYKQNSPFWNPLRKSKTIVGRGFGSYTNLWGQEAFSFGTYAGRPLNFKKKEKFGNRAIQSVEAWLIVNGRTRVERRIEVEIEKFFSQDLRKYFIEGGK